MEVKREAVSKVKKEGGLGFKVKKESSLKVKKESDANKNLSIGLNSRGSLQRTQLSALSLRLQYALPYEVSSPIQSSLTFGIQRRLNIYFP